MPTTSTLPTPNTYNSLLFLFLFILVLEASGYMVRAAFLMDRMMAGAGLSGRAFIPLLSSFACAVPGIMSTRSIQDPRDRLAVPRIARQAIDRLGRDRHDGAARQQDRRAGQAHLVWQQSFGLHP